MIDRADLFNRWHSLALIIGTRAAGKTQSFDATSRETKAPPMPSAKDWLERQELTGGMLRWLHSAGHNGAQVVEQMHVAIIEANDREIQKLLARIEDAEWMVKVKWKGGAHCRMLHTETDIDGRAQWERRIIMTYRGVRTEDAAAEEGLSVGKIRWVRRKHGLTIEGQRMYPCTIAPLNSCPACSSLNEYADEYERQEAA